MPRSLLDTADLGVLRAAVAARPWPAGVLVSCLLEGGALAYAPDDPDWADRDHLVLGSPLLERALREAGGPSPLAVEDGGVALAVAAGVAAGGALDGGVAQVYCLLDGAAADDGALWEGALAATSEALTAVFLLAAAEESRVRPLLAAAGWRTTTAPADEPLALLGALDRARPDGATDPGAVLAVLP